MTENVCASNGCHEFEHEWKSDKDMTTVVTMIGLFRLFHRRVIYDSVSYLQGNCDSMFTKFYRHYFVTEKEEQVAGVDSLLQKLVNIHYKILENCDYEMDVSCIYKGRDK